MARKRNPSQEPTLQPSPDNSVDKIHRTKLSNLGAQEDEVYNGKYNVVNPAQTYKGKPYSEWITDWVNWFFGIAPDEDNNGPVVFLKQYPRLANPSNSVEEVERPYIFKNDPNVMIGGDRLEIFSDQAILFPAIMAYWAATDPEDTEEVLRKRVRSDLDNGDNPPRIEQITVNNKPLEIRKTEDPSVLVDLKDEDEVREEMLKYRIETSLFPLLVADGKSGTYKDYVEYPTPEGSFNAVACGYYFLLGGFKADKQYIIHSRARGRNTEIGEYYAELLYQINVRDRGRRTTSPQSGVIPYKITKRLYQKVASQEENLSDTESRWIWRIVKGSRN